jgi:hypothetical protein
MQRKRHLDSITWTQHHVRGISLLYVLPRLSHPVGIGLHQTAMCCRRPAPPPLSAARCLPRHRPRRIRQERNECASRLGARQPTVRGNVTPVLFMIDGVHTWKFCRPLDDAHVTLDVRRGVQWHDVTMATPALASSLFVLNRNEIDLITMQNPIASAVESCT